MFGDAIEFHQRRRKIEVADGCAQSIQVRLVDNARNHVPQTAKRFLGTAVARIE